MLSATVGQVGGSPVAGTLAGDILGTALGEAGPHTQLVAAAPCTEGVAVGGSPVRRWAAEGSPCRDCRGCRSQAWQWEAGTEGRGPASPGAVLPLGEGALHRTPLEIHAQILGCNQAVVAPVYYIIQITNQTVKVNFV